MLVVDQRRQLTRLQTRELPRRQGSEGEARVGLGSDESVFEASDAGVVSLAVCRLVRQSTNPLSNASDPNIEESGVCLPRSYA